MTADPIDPARQREIDRMEAHAAECGPGGGLHFVDPADYDPDAPHVVTRLRFSDGTVYP